MKREYIRLVVAVLVFVLVIVLVATKEIDTGTIILSILATLNLLIAIYWVYRNKRLKKGD